jgi:hypothetical protein
MLSQALVVVIPALYGLLFGIIIGMTFRRSR